MKPTISIRTEIIRLFLFNNWVKGFSFGAITGKVLWTDSL